MQDRVMERPFSPPVSEGNRTDVTHSFQKGEIHEPQHSR